MASPEESARPGFSNEDLQQVAKFLSNVSFGSKEKKKPTEKATHARVVPRRPVPPLEVIRKPTQNGYVADSRQFPVNAARTTVPQPRLRSRSRSTLNRNNQPNENTVVPHRRHNRCASIDRNKEQYRANGSTCSALEHIKKLIKDGSPAERGVVNDGVYCYAIVFVQSLLGTNTFPRLSLSSDVDWGTSPHIVKRLIQVLRLLWINDPSASNAVKKLVYDVAQSNYSLDVMKQQDVFEFMTLLFGKISASIDINMRSTEILLRNICTGVLQYTSRCTGCDYKRKSTERFTALSLPIPQKPLNEINVYAVTGDSVIAYGLRTQREPSVKEVITCIASDCRVSQNNCAVMAFNGNRLKVFDPQSLLVTAMNFPMFTVVEMTPDTTISNEIEALVFPRGDSITAPYVCAIDLKWAPATIWRRIVTTVFFWERGKTLPELGDIEVSVANKQGYFEQFVDRGRRGFHSLHPRHCFWRQNTSRKFIVLRIDLSSSQGALTLYPRSEYEHESYKANQGPLLDTLVETYFREERIPFTCRNCSSSSLIRTASIAECPQILFLHLNRFARNGSATLKVTSKLRIPRDVLDITDYTGFAASRRNSGCDEVERYHLCAVICHIGDSVSSGHYQCYRRNPVTQKWRLFSDSHVFPFEFPEFLSSSSAYFLIYEKPSNDSSVNEGHWFRKMNANDLISTVFHNYRM